MTYGLHQGEDENDISGMSNADVRAYAAKLQRRAVEADKVMKAMPSLSFMGEDWVNKNQLLKIWDIIK